MNSCLSRALTFAFLTLVAARGAAAADRLADAPSPYENAAGTLRVLETEKEGAAVVLSKNPQQRLLLPMEEAEPSANDEYHSSPDDQWLMGLHHVGSGLRDATLYHILGSTKVQVVKKAAPFSRVAWQSAVRLGAFKRNFSEEGFGAMTFFGGWSSDSARLLVMLGGGEEKRSFAYRYLYFNLQTQTFELTEYLRKVNKAPNAPIAAPEPLTPLPEEADLKSLYATCDAELNKVYRQKLAASNKESAFALRDGQRDWIKQRDAGLPLYVTSFPAAERERRRLQYLAAATAAQSDRLRNGQP